MLPDRVSNPEPLTYESGALPIALRGPAASPNLQNVVMTISSWPYFIAFMVRPFLPELIQGVSLAASPLRFQPTVIRLSGYCYH